MRRKLPIAETALESVQFGLHHIWTAIRLGWPAAAISALCAYGIGAMFAPDVAIIRGYLAELEVAYSSGSNFITVVMSAGEGIERAIDERLADDRFAQKLILSVVLSIVTIASFIPVAIAFLRIASGSMPVPKGWFFFEWGSRAWYAIATAIGMTLAMLAGASAILTLGHHAAGDLGDRLFPGAGVLAVILYVICLATIVWLALRCALIIPAAAIEGRFNFGAAFAATGGNVFRILGSSIVLGLLIMGVMLATAIVTLTLTLLFGTMQAMTGLDTPAGRAVELISFVLTNGIVALASIATNVAGLAWSGKAWAALRA